MVAATVPGCHDAKMRNNSAAPPDKALKPDTLITTLGRDPESNFGIVNPPVYHASTILFPTLDALESAEKTFDPRRSRYGRYGTPTMFALEEAIAGLEGGGQSIVVSCGAAAITAALLAFIKTGDHVLLADTVYGPTRRVASTLLQRFAVAVTFYDPLIGGDIAGLIQPNTRLILMASPGSLT